VKRTAENQRKVVAVRVNPQIEQRLRLLAELTGRRQSFFLQQMIEGGIGAMEATWAATGCSRAGPQRHDAVAATGERRDRRPLWQLIAR
jgi:predicted DNA-binding protein